MDIERALEKCGNYGRYQLVLLLLFGYTNIMSSMHYFSQTLITFTPEHWCYHEQLENRTFEEISDVYKKFPDPHCTLLEYNDGVFERAEVGECRKWFYKKENNYESVTTELNWVCDSAFQSAVGQSFYYLGAVVGTITFGLLADRFGRLPAILMTTLSGGLGDFLSTFTYTMPTFALTRFISGLSTDTVFMLMYILAFEYLSPKKRTFGLNIIPTTFYCTGIMLSPWFAMWVKTWRYYLIIASTPVLMVFVYPLFACESAGWLLTREKYDRAVRSLKFVAKFNGREVEEKVFDEFVEYYKHKAAEVKKLKNTDTFVGMFKTPRLRKMITILLLKSVICTMAFDIISRNMEGLGSSPFRLFSYSGIVYVPAGLTIIIFQNIIGRKGMATASLFVGSIITAVTGFLVAFLDPQENAILLAVMVGLGRYGAVVAYDAEMQYCTEIVPTSVRGRAVSNVHVIGYGFSFLNAYVIYMGNFYKPLPSIFISIIMLVGAGLCLCLPETLKKKLPENLSDGEQFGLDEKWFYFPCFRRRSKADVEKSGEVNSAYVNANVDVTHL